MAAPNLQTATTITGKTTGYAVSSTSLAIALGPVATGKVLKVNSIFCSNINGSNFADITVTVFNGSSHTHLVSTLSVPADATQIISNKDTYFYLEEGFSIQASASIVGYLQLVISYEDIS